MIKLKSILNEIDQEKALMASWMTPTGTPDVVIETIHAILQQVMNKMGSGNDLVLAHYFKTMELDKGKWAILNPSSGMMLTYTRRGGIWEVRMAEDIVGRQLNETDLENVIIHWMR